MCHAPQRTDLLDDSRGAAAAGRLLYGARGGESVLAGGEDAVPGNRGYGDARRGNLPQPDDRGRAKVLSGAGTEGHECNLVTGAGDVYQGDCGGRSRCEYPQLQ